MLFLVCFRGVHPDFRVAEFRAAVEATRRSADPSYRLDAADAAANVAAAAAGPPAGVHAGAHPLTVAAAAEAAATAAAAAANGAASSRPAAAASVDCVPPLRLSPTIGTLPSWAAATELARMARSARLAPQGEVFYYVHLADEAEAAAVAARCVLVRAILVPIAHGAVIAEAVDAAVAAADAGAAAYGELLAPPGDAPTFKCVCECFGRTLTPDDQLARFEHFRPVLSRFGGRVRLKAPDVEVWVLEDGTPLGGRRPPTGAAAPAAVEAAACEGLSPPSLLPPPAAASAVATAQVADPLPLSQVLLARLIGRGCARVCDDYSLKRRSYIGPTAMDAALSFIMANLGLVRRHTVVLDPFAGTGSCLVAAAARGAAVFASDLSLKALTGKEAAVDMASNFVQYGLPPALDAVRMDVLFPAWRWPAGGVIHAVVCDPPYGIREGSRAFAADAAAASVAAAGRPGPPRPYAPATVRVAFDDFLHHLLHAAAAALVPGGRLVYWLPTVPDEYAPADLPVHPLLRLVANCEQPLSSKLSRRLITMERLPDAPLPPLGGRSTGIIDAADAARPLAVPLDPRAVPLPRRTHVPAHANLAAKVFGTADRLEDALQRRPVDGAAVLVKGLARRKESEKGGALARSDAAEPHVSAAGKTDAALATATAVSALSMSR
ncbi:hypothetical protein MMPV_002468 [Pyropia vietnamensis]